MNAQANLSRLLEEYESAIWAREPDPARIDALAAQVEAAADAANYTNHRRLYALHTAAERVCEGAQPWA